MRIWQQKAGACRLQVGENRGTGKLQGGIKTRGSDSVREFTAGANVKGMHIVFTPESSLDRSSGKYIKEMLRGCTVKEHPKNMIMEKYEEDNAKGQTP